MFRCNGKVFEAEKCPTKVGPFHKNCFSCIECSKKLDSVTCCEGPDGEIYCKERAPFILLSQTIFPSNLSGIDHFLQKSP